MSFFIAEQRRLLDNLHQGEAAQSDLIDFLAGTLGPFAEERVAPGAHHNDRAEVFDVELFKALGELGFMALSYPEAYGGFGAPWTYYVAGLESLAKADAGFTLGVAIHGTACEGIRRFASEELKERYLPDLIQGRHIACFGLSEVEAGSDAKAMRTTYRVADEGFVLRGSKYWITNALDADVFFVMAAKDEPGGQISAFLVTPGGAGRFERHKIEGKMGVRGSNTAELVFEDYVVPRDHLIGEEGRGFAYAMSMLAGGRVTIGAWSTGVAQGAYEKFLTYAHQRRLFGTTLAELDTVKAEVATMAIEIAAARLLTYDAALAGARGESLRLLAPMAKVKATEVAFTVAERALQLAGGYGYVTESRIERHLRDALLGRIGEGANELLKAVVIPRELYRAFEAAGGGRDPW